jgi:hypothetical protein
MEMVQSFESTVADADTGHSVSFAVFPADYLWRGDPPMQATVDSVLAEMGLKRDGEAVAPSALPRVIRSMLMSDDCSVTQEMARQAMSTDQLAVPEDVQEFAERVAYAELVPAQESPISLHSLASLAMRAATKGPPALAVGFFVAYAAVGASPLLVALVPAGVVLCGASVALSKFLDENRNQIFGKLFGVQARSRGGRNAPSPPAGTKTSAVKKA